MVSIHIAVVSRRLYSILTYSYSLPKYPMVSLHTSVFSIESQWYPYIYLQCPERLYGIPTYSCSVPRESMVSLRIAEVSL